MQRENLGPAERIIQTLLTFSDHLVHNRPGVVMPSTNAIGVQWYPAIWKQEGEDRVVYRKEKVGKKTRLVKVGTLQADKITISGTTAKYRPAGLFPEVAVWMYRQVAEVWKLDSEFAARWASYVYKNDKIKDRKVIMAAFMLVQSKKGDPIRDNGKVLFYDDDFRDVGEAMMLLDKGDYLDLKLILRIREVLTLPQIADINRELGFGQSTRNPFLGRYQSVATSWLRYREENPKMLAGLIKSGWTKSLRDLAKLIQYKPTTPEFFKLLRWKQVQAKDGHRSLAIGEAVKAAETWEGLTETQVCEKIVATKPDFKRVVGLLPKSVGLTPAVMMASIEAGCLSNKDLTIQIPTLEELGLMTVPAVKARVDAALKAATDQRSANIALRVKSKELQEKLVTAAEEVSKKEVAEAVKDLEVIFLVDVSGSMTQSIELARHCLSKLVSAFPLEKITAAIFDTAGRILTIKHASAAGVDNAFSRGLGGGGTSHASGVLALRDKKLKEGTEALIIWIGDEEEGRENSDADFSESFSRLHFKPAAFGFIKVRDNRYRFIQNTAAALRIPCMFLNTQVFEDPYAFPQTISHLIASTPVGVQQVRSVAPRETLVDTIIKTDLLTKPLWAA